MTDEEQKLMQALRRVVVAMGGLIETMLEIETERRGGKPEPLIKYPAPKKSEHPLREVTQSDPPPEPGQ